GAPALNAEIAVILDPNLTVLSTTPGSTRRVGDTLFFALGDLPALAPVGTIVLETELDPNVPPGTELCATALITAANACPPDSGPALRVTAQCTENDSVRFVVNNLGDPATNIPYVVIEDEVMFQQGAFDVDAGEQETFLFPAGTGTYHFSTLANPDAVMPTKTAATLSCADAPELGQRYFPATDLQQHVSVDCQPNFGVDFDSIGLDCTPLGLTNERIVLPESTLDYRVYFQHDNAGGNTAVTIVDTLPAAVDPATLSLGAASHPYAWSLEGERTLKVTFSNLTEPELSGFVNFRVQLSPTASPGTEVNNYAEVYYAADPPVVTNRTQRKVGTLVDKTTALSSVSVQPDLLRVYPQPASDFLYLERQDGVPLRGELSVFTADGSRISRGPARGQRQRVFVQNLPPGMYFIVLRDRADAQVYTRRFVVD
ncbi:MAG: T9SS type A sorting domain-containing protein, partial [Bacteroidota bacterium]